MKKGWLVSWFMIVLVLMLPIYTSTVFAEMNGNNLKNKTYWIKRAEITKAVSWAKVTPRDVKEAVSEEKVAVFNNKNDDDNHKNGLINNKIIKYAAYGIAALGAGILLGLVGAKIVVIAVVVLPLVSSDVFAAILTEVKASGSAGLQNFLKGNDTLIVTGRAGGMDIEVTSEHIFLFDQILNMPFRSCELSGEDLYFCVYAGEEREWSQAYYTGYVVRLCDIPRLECVQRGTYNRTASFSFTIDDFPPVISSLEAEQSNQEILLSYNVTERGAENQQCSGIKNIILSGKKTDAIGDPLRINETIYDTEGCDEISEELSLNKSQLSSLGITNYYGNLTFCLDANDRLNNPAEQACQNLTVDFKQPHDLRLFVNDRYISGSGVDVYINDHASDINIKIHIIDEGEGFNDGNVWGNFSDLDDINPQEWANEQAECSLSPDDSELWICGFNIVTTKFDPPETLAHQATLYFNVTDDVGNSIDESRTVSFVIDEEAPNVTGINSTKDGWIGRENNTVYAVIDQMGGSEIVSVNAMFGGGLRYNNSAGPIPTHENVSGTYYWHNLTCSSQDGCTGTTVSVTVTAVDEAGNEINIQPVELRTDFAAPIINNFTLKEQSEGRTEHYVGGDTLLITANVTDTLSGSVKILSNLSSIDAGIFDEPCEDAGNNTWACRIASGGIASGPLTADLEFFFTDLVGNQNSTVVSNFIIANLTNETEPNHWKVNYITRMPDKINSETTALQSQRAFFKITFIAISEYPDAQLIKIEVDQCSGNGTDFLESTAPQKLNAGYGSREPYLIFTIIEEQITEPSIDFNCTLLLRTKIGDTVWENDEHENISFSIPLYSSADMSARLRDEIDRVADSKIVRATWVGKWDRAAQKARTLCNLVTRVSVSSQVVGVAEGALSWLDAIPILNLIPKGLGILANILGGAENIIESLPFVGSFCKFVTCKFKLNTWLIDIMESWPGMGTMLTVLAPVSVDPHTGQRYDPPKHPALSDIIKPEDSLIFSTVQLCLPGILHNLQKMRQIECGYIKCLRDDVPAGYSVADCGKMRNMQRCEYVWGEIFQVIPWANLGKKMLSELKELLRDPLAVGGAVLAIACLPSLGFSSTIHSLCVIAAAVDSLTRMYEVLNAWFEPVSWNPPRDYCQVVLGY